MTTHASRVSSRRAGYTLGELEEILYRELHPVLIWNLANVAGEWAGFDEKWLENEVLARGERSRAFCVVFGKYLVRGEWEKVKARLAP